MDMDWSVLSALIACHSTPGDEDEVAALLLKEWSAAGWPCQAHGRYAISARSPQWQNGRPTVLICAHMDSPGLIVQSVSAGKIVAVTLGGISSDSADGARAAVKKISGRVPAVLRPTLQDPGCFILDGPGPYERGDRVCYAADISMSAQSVRAPFLDNRLGCQQLCALTRALAAPGNSCQAVNIIVAATANEEFSGFGAAVMAAACPADLVICLDATYADAAQGVRLGAGPVLTISDRSVLLGRWQWRCLQVLCEHWQVPLQTEIYNFSGTDAKAFPLQGCSAPVLPILLATTGNHSPRECVRKRDVVLLQQLLRELCADRDAVSSLCNQGFGPLPSQP